MIIISYRVGWKPISNAGFSKKERQFNPHMAIIFFLSRWRCYKRHHILEYRIETMHSVRWLFAHVVIWRRGVAQLTCARDLRLRSRPEARGGVHPLTDLRVVPVCPRAPLGYRSASQMRGSGGGQESSASQLYCTRTYPTGYEAGKGIRCS